MKNLIFLFLASILLLACNDKSAPQDTETNKFYADYLAIYAAYDSVGNEGTLKSLNSYLDEFPDRYEAYIFKAYILGKMGDTSEAYKFFDIAREMDSLAIASYEYQAAFMLYDTTQNEATAALIEQGLSINDSSGLLWNHHAWLNLLEGNYENGLSDVSKGVQVQPKTKDLYRTGFLLSTLLQEDSSKTFYAERISKLGIGQPDSLEQMLNNSGAFEVLKSLL
jgi:tetratricopeptide (TPR) repeat protein